MEDCSKPPFMGEATKRKTYTLEFKLGVLDWYKRHQSSVRGTARRFGVHRRMVQRWLDNESELTAAAVTSGMQRKKLSSGRPPLSTELDISLLSWLISQEGSSISDKELQQKALQLASELAITDFKASPMWLKAWKKRNSIKSIPGGNEVLQTPPTNYTIPVINGDALLAHTNPNDTIRLTFIEEQEMTTPLNQDNICYDYSTPEHNYCQPLTKSHDNDVVSGGNEWLDVVILNGEDEQVILGHEETVGQEDKQGVNVVIDVPSKRTRRRPRPLSSLCSGSDDGVLTIGNRLSEPIFSVGPEIIFLGQ